MTIQERFASIVTICPSTGHLVEYAPVTVQTTSSGMAVWWRCSACHRWHVSEMPASMKKVDRPRRSH